MAKTEIQDLIVLIADSNAFIAKTLSTILEAFGVRKIIMSDTLEDAEKKFYNAEFDCIFVDFMMDNRAGLEFIKKIRTNPSSKNNSDLPIILETGVTDITTITKARDSGVTEVISKPFSPEQVLQKLDNAVNNKREFIDVEEFVGPNRRRRRDTQSEWVGENDRRSSATNHLTE